MSNRIKVQKNYLDFANEVEKLDATALKARIVGLQQALEESEAHKEANDVLAQAKAELNGPYQDVKKAIKLKTKYIIDLLKERG